MRVQFKQIDESPSSYKHYELQIQLKEEGGSQTDMTRDDDDDSRPKVLCTELPPFDRDNTCSGAVGPMFLQQTSHNHSHFLSVIYSRHPQAVHYVAGSVTL